MEPLSSPVVQPVATGGKCLVPEKGRNEPKPFRRLRPVAESSDRSAVTDCVKPTESGFAGRKAVLIYGFDDPKPPLMWLIEAFELIAGKHVNLGDRHEAPLRNLIHPIFASGGVFAWELYARNENSAR
jgi:hypothetical protein